MKKLICCILAMLLLAGCGLSNQAATDDMDLTARNRAEDRTLTTAAGTEAAPVVLPTEETAEATEESTEAPDDALGVEMELTEGLTVTPGMPWVEFLVTFPQVDLRGCPEGQLVSLTLEVDGEAVEDWPELRIMPGSEQRCILKFEFNRYTPDRDAVVRATLRRGEKRLVRETTVKVDNYPEELYLLMTGDTLPYSIDVLRNQNVVIVYGRDQDDKYTIPVKVWLCSTGSATPKGKYKLGNKQAWGLLFGNVYGQYVCGITGNILFHSVPYEKKTKDSLETEEYNKLGTAASLGCIRLAAGDAKWIYDRCPTGTPVHIYDVKELPVERPELVPIDPDDPRAGWDPTDPDEKNPWLSDN